MSPPKPSRPRFFPRLTVLFLLTGGLFFGSMLVYAWPAMIARPPPGAIPSWNTEQVQKRLSGKVRFFLLGSVAVAGLIAWRFFPDPHR